MAKWDDAKTHNQIKAYPQGSAQGGRAIQAVKGGMSDNDGTSGHRTIIRETSEGRAIARTRDGMPMVEVEKQGCEIGVDHGVIDLHGLAPLGPDIYKDGNLYFTPFVAAHITAAGAEDPDRPIVDEIEPPDSVKGTPPADGAVAKSVSAKLNPDKIDALYAKKLMMSRCPSSIFTGKTRLWVQALYGRHDALSLVSLADTLPSATPGLVVVGAGDSEQTWITTNCGVYLDPVTAEHWMIDVEFNQVNFYPLEVAEDCIDELRSFLLDTEFPAEDKERVETYILADSAPVLSKKQTVSIPETHGYAMGYGWHFNWAGDRCDIVHVGGNEDGDNVSMHYRLTFAKSETGVWSATRSVVEGPSVWRNRRHRNVIAHPQWDEFSLLKIGPVSGGTGSGPFYVFYRRNELQVCRYTAETTSFSEQVIVRTPYYLNPGAPLGIGPDAYEYEKATSWSGTFHTVSCGAVSVTGHQDMFYSGGFSGSDAAEGGVAITYPGGVPMGANTFSLITGYPIGISLSSVADGAGGLCEAYADSGGISGLTHGTGTFGPFPGEYQDWQLINGSWLAKNFNRTTNRTATSITVIPFYDAEAAYILGSTTKYVSESGTQQTQSAVRWWRWIVRSSGQVISQIAVVGNSVSGGAGSSYSTEHTPVTESNSYLVSNNGVKSGVEFPGASDFFATDLAAVSQFYSTRTSASGNSVSAPSNGVAEGLPENNVDNFVGWA